MAELTASTVWQREALTRSFDWVNDDIRLILMDNYYGDPTQNTNYNAVDHNEVNGSGYLAGGRSLQNKTISQIGYAVRYRCDEVSWLEYGGTARYALMVHWKSEDILQKWVMATIDFGAIVYGNISPIIVRWNSNIALQSNMIVGAP